MTEQVPAGIDHVARSVAEVKTYDPALGAYTFNNLGDVVRFADLMSKAGEMLPDHLRQKPALCLAVTMRATQWKMDPFALAMETYQAKQGGPIGYQAKVFTAALNGAGVKLRYRYEGEVKMIDKPVTSYKGNEIAKRTATGNRKCIAYATVDGDTLEYETMTLDQITIKNSPMWHNDPDQQLAYAAGRGWARRYRADVIMGAYSDDEVRAMTMKDVTPKETAFTKLVNQAREQAEEPATAPETVEEAGEAIEPTRDAPEPQPALSDEEIERDAFPGSDAFTHGVDAFNDGKPESDCPYDLSEARQEAVDWCGGWRQARRAKE